MSFRNIFFYLKVNVNSNIIIGDNVNSFMIIMMSMIMIAVIILIALLKRKSN